MPLLWPTLFLVFNAQITYFDFTQRRAPNRLLALALGLQAIWVGGLYAGWLPPPLGSGSLLDLTGSFIAALVLFFPFWKLKIFGAGDVKYIAVLGFLLGYADALTVVLLGSVVIGAYALGIRFLGTIPRFVLFSENQRERRVPYAGCIAAVCFIWVFWRIAQGV